MRQIAGFSEDQSIIDVISWLVYLSWTFLGLSILAAIIYFYCSAKCVKLAWGQDPDFFGKKELFGINIIREEFVEKILDGSYFFMMVGFIIGLSSIFIFIINYSSINVNTTC